MRVLFLHNRYQIRGGEDITLETEMRLLRESGHEVDLYEETNLDIESLASKISTALSVHYNHEQTQKVAARIREFRPDIVHAHNLFPKITVAAYDACIEEKVPVVQTMHNYRAICANGLLLRNGTPCEKCVSGSPFHALAYRCYKNSRIGSAAVARMVAYQRRSQVWNKKVNAIVAITPFAKQKFVAAGISEKKIIVKPNPTEDYLQDFQQIPKDNFVLFVGRLSEEKGILSLVKAWRNMPLPLKILGAGPLEGALRDVASDQVHFVETKSRQEVLSSIRQATALILPTVCYEGGFPMVLAEALCLETPVIASQIGGIPDYLEHGKNGFLLPPGDFSGLAERLDLLLKNPALRSEIAAAGRNVYEEHFHPRHHLQNIMEIYQTVITKSSG